MEIQLNWWWWWCFNVEIETFLFVSYSSSVLSFFNEFLSPLGFARQLSYSIFISFHFTSISISIPLWLFHLIYFYDIFGYKQLSSSNMFHIPSCPYACHYPFMLLTLCFSFILSSVCLFANSIIYFIGWFILFYRVMVKSIHFIA